MVQDREINAQLQRILRSAAFRNSARSSQFLSFCVERSITGRASELKETTIAVALFQRAADYDPKRDPIVRVHAKRVRDKLLDYYSSDGSRDKIRIEMPKGSYVPQFSADRPSLPGTKGLSDHPTSANAEKEDRQCLTTAKEPDLAPEPATSSPRFSGRSLTWRIALPVVLAFFLTVYLFFALRPRSQAPIAGGMVPIDGALPAIRELAWSPDGDLLAYSGAEKIGAPTHIYVQDVRHHGMPKRLTTEDQEESRPVWSPNGRDLAFVRTQEVSKFEIVRITLGQTAIHPVATIRLFQHLFSPVLDWSPDGKSLLTCEQTSSLTPVRLVIFALATGEKRLLTSPPAFSTGDIDAKFSPDGTLVAFQRGGLGDLYVVSIAGEGSAGVKQLTADNPGVRGMAWADGGRSLLFASQREHSPVYRIWKIPAAGGQSEPLTPEGFDVRMPALSAQQGLALLHIQRATSMFEQSLTNAFAPRQLPFSGAGEEWPRYSPDGNEIAFVSSRSGSEELWIYRHGDSEPRQLTHFNGAGRVFWASWSPDGQSMVFPFRLNGATMLYTYDLRNNVLRQLTHTSHRHFSPTYSGDGRYIYFSSNDDGTPRIWRIHSDGSSGPEAMFWEGLMPFALSSDGKWFYSAVEQEEGVEIFRRNTETGENEPLVTLPGQLISLNDITVTKDKLYLITRQAVGTKGNLVVVDLKTRSVTTGAQLELTSWPEETSFSISPRQKTIVLTHTSLGESVLYHWVSPSHSGR